MESAMVTPGAQGARIAPLDPPFTAQAQAWLSRINPPAAPTVLALFRLLARHGELADRMRVWGGFLLGPRACLPLRARELVIDRVCFRCGAAYEWGVHVAAFADAAGLTPPQLQALASPPGSGFEALPPADRLLLDLVDQLHDSGQVGDTLWEALAAQWNDQQLIELLMLAGWYHAIAWVCNATRLAPEPWAAPFPG